MSESMVLTGQRTRLREFQPTDLDASLTVVGDDRVTTHLSFDSKTREQQFELLTAAIQRSLQEPRLEYYLAITTLADDLLIGFARLGLSGVQAAKLGYAISADHWRKGYASDATKVLIEFGFKTLRLHRITAAIGPDNAASIAVVRKHGFVREGTLRDHVFTNGAWRDSELYSLLAHEWQHGADQRGIGTPNAR